MREVGTIKFMHPTGYGFITRSNGVDVYFHASQCGDLWKKNRESQIQKGSNVTFELGKSMQGTEEAKVIKLELSK